MKLRFVFPVLVAAVLAAVVFPRPAFGELPVAGAPVNSYDMEFFSSDGPLHTATASHSFVRLRRFENGRFVEVVDISWLPQPGFFRRRGRVPAFATVPGRNYSLEETFALVGSAGRRILSHGRFPVAEALFLAARRRKAELESGAIAYKMIDGGTFPYASNCIHAISGMLAYVNTGLRRGATATASLVDFFASTGLLGVSAPAFAAAPPPPPATLPPATPLPPAFQTHAPCTVACGPAPVEERRRPILNFLARRR